MARGNPSWLHGKRVAIVTDWLTTYGGAEKVTKTISDMFPEAPIFTSQYSEREVDWFIGRDVRTGWLNRLPARWRKILGPLRLWYFSRLRLDDFEVIISVAISESKGVKTGPEQLHISYLQGPPVQYYWGMYDEYVKNPGFGRLNWLVRWFFRLLVGPLRRFDYKLAQRPDVLIANSTYSAEEIKRYYHRTAEVVFPPVEVDAFRAASGRDDYFISTSRQVNWKRLDLAVEAFRQTGQRLLLVGGGAEHERLVAMAAGAKNIEFIDTVSDARQLASIVAAARGFIFPSLEPFGIAPIEALSAGVPVIAYQKGGAIDYIEDGKNGLFFQEQTVESLAAALHAFDRLRFTASTVARSAQRFSTKHFKRRLALCIRRYCDRKN